MKDRILSKGLKNLTGETRPYFKRVQLSIQHKAFVSEEQIVIVEV